MNGVRALRILTAHLVVALVALVAIGGATRVMQAGLACPDWPLCYGSLLPGGRMNLQVFLEWFHRLDAFLVGLALVVLQGLSLVRRRGLPGWVPWACAAALLLVVLQGTLGALTVTQLLRFDLVTAHLATALLLVALLSALHQGIAISTAAPSEPAPQALHHGWWITATGLTLLVFAQAVSGALMASQWAAGLCLSRGEGCAWLALHRASATPVALAVISFAALHLLAPGRRRLAPLALASAVLVALQVALGVMTLRLSLSAPLVTVGHQVTAALLVAVLSALSLRHALPVDNVSLPLRAGSASDPRLESCHG